MNMVCPICSKQMKMKKTNMKVSDQNIKLFYCRDCNYFAIDNDSIPQTVETGDYKDLLESVSKVRRHNHKLIAKTIIDIIGKDRIVNGLEVGSARGEFLALKKKCKNMKFCGIEPMQESCDYSIKKGLNVHNGFFPQDMPIEWKDYDVIVFNDVFEHIPDSKATLNGCSKVIKEGGYIFLNLPVNNGLFFKIGKVFDLLGRPEAFVRLWQLHTPTPHVHYYSDKAIIKLMNKNGYSLVGRPINMMVLDRDNIEKRVYAVPMNKNSAKLIIKGVKLFFPLLVLLSHDTKCFVFRRMA